MKRFAIFATTCASVFWIGAVAWSQQTAGGAAAGGTAGAGAGTTIGTGAAGTPGVGAAGTPGIGAAGGITGQVQAGGGITGQGVPAGQQQPTGLDPTQFPAGRLDPQQLQQPGVTQPGVAQPGLAPRQPGFMPRQPGVQPQLAPHDISRPPLQRRGDAATFPGVGTADPRQFRGGFPGGISPQPWFANPAARRQIGLDDAQFDQLSTGWQQAWQRLLNGTGRTNGADTLDPRQLDPQELPQTLDPQQLDQQRLPQTLDPQQLHRPEPPRGERLDEQQMRMLEALSPAERAQRLREMREGPRHASRFSPPERDLRMRAGLTPFDEQFQRLSPQEQEQRLHEMRQAFHENFRRTLDTTLTDPQARARFDQLALQAQGFAAFDLPAVRMRLNLTPVQQQQFNMLNREWNLRLARLNQLSQVDPVAAREHFHALREQMKDRIGTLLTAQQLDTWAQLTGDPFPFGFDDFHPADPRHDPAWQIERQRMLQEQVQPQQQLDAIFDPGFGIRGPGIPGPEVAPGVRGTDVAEVDIGMRGSAIGRAPAPPVGTPATPSTPQSR